jgi:large conductance mechanosensitive channel
LIDIHRQPSKTATKRADLEVCSETTRDFHISLGYASMQARGNSMLSGFKQFLLRGNVIDLAVAVVIGAAFGAVVSALVKDLLTPLIAALLGKPDFSRISFTVNGSTFAIGDFLNVVLAFVLISAAVYFFVVVPVNLVVERQNRGKPPADPTTKVCPECLSTVAIGARRCAFCTSALPV